MDSGEPLVSIVTPVYNVEKYLAACLDSLRAQTLKNWEAICVDDGSIDASPAILDAYAAKDSRFVVIHQKNQGVSLARNAALERARGRYILFIDSDDWVEPDVVQKIYEAMESSGAEIGAYSCRVLNVPSGTEEIRFPARFMKEGDGVRCCPIERILMGCLHYSIGDKVLRRSLLQHGLRFRSGIRIGEDMQFIVRCLAYSRKMCLIPDAFYHYNEGIGVTNCRVPLWQRASYQELKDILQVLDGVPAMLPDSLRGAARRNFLSGLLHVMIRHRQYMNTLLQGMLGKGRLFRETRSALFRVFLRSSYRDSLRILWRSYIA